MTNSDLVTVFSGQLNDQTALLCNARDLHKFVESKQQYTDWIKNRIADYGFTENEDYIIVTERTAGRPRKEYHITLDMGKELGMVERNEKGRMVRKYFIARERQAKEQEKVLAQLGNKTTTDERTGLRNAVDSKTKPLYTGDLSKNNKRLPHPSDLAVFLCQFNGGTIAGKYKTLGEYSAAATCYAESESRHPQSNVANLSINNKELAMANIITADYNGTQVFFQDDAYLNATAIAKHFNKLPNEWLRLESTQEYIDLLCKKLNTGKSRILKTTRGVNGGTWLHRRLAVPFARWLNVEFAIWCDEQIEKILLGDRAEKTQTTVDDRTGLRNAVNMLVSKKGLIYSDAYNIVHQYMNVDSIEDIDKADLPKAVAYVHKLVLEGELIDKPTALLPEPKADVVEIPRKVAQALVKFHRLTIKNAEKAEKGLRAIHEIMGYERYHRNNLAAGLFDLHHEFNYWIDEFERATTQPQTPQLRHVNF